MAETAQRIHRFTVDHLREPAMQLSLDFSAGKTMAMFDLSWFSVIWKMAPFELAGLG
jgi:hypothetical protein